MILSREGSDWDEDTIIRVFVSRSELDLKIISDKFQDLSGRNLEKSIQQDSGGDFQSILLKILNPDLKLNWKVEIVEYNILYHIILHYINLNINNPHFLLKINHINIR